jgi:hypothetical protein
MRRAMSPCSCTLLPVAYQLAMSGAVASVVWPRGGR